MAGGLVLLAGAAMACGGTEDVVVEGGTSRWEGQHLGDLDADVGAAMAEVDGVLVAAASTESGDLRTWRSVDGGELEGPSTAPGVADANLQALAGGPQGFVAIANDWSQDPAAAPVVWRSPDGASWQPVADDLGDLGGSSEVGDLVATASGYVAVGAEVTSGEEGAASPRAWWSDDGASWTAVHLGATVGFAASVAADGEVLHALGEHTAWSSEDGGRTWTSNPIPDETSTLSFGASGLAAVDGVLLTSMRGEHDGGDAREQLFGSGDAGRTWAPIGLTGAAEVPLGEAALFGGSGSPAWLLAKGHADPYSNPDLCYADPAACGGGGPFLLQTEDGEAWRAIDVAAATGSASFDVADVLETSGRDTVVLALDDGLATWTWPASAGPLPDAPVESPPDGSTLPVASEDVTLEVGETYRYPKDTHCGIDELGVFNEQVWHVEGVSGDGPYAGEADVSADWPQAGGSILGYLTLVDEDTIEYSIEPGGEPVATYRPEPLSELWGCM
jgi:hypothetical protein